MLLLPEPAKTRSRNLATSLQDWAYGLMETANSAQATRILELEVCDDYIRPNACMDVAMATGAKKFLTQRHCVKLMDIYWRGGIPGSSIEISQGHNMLLLLLFAVLPIFNPYLWRRTQGQKEQAAKLEARHRTDSVIDALGMVFRVLGDGPGGDKVHEEAMGILSSAKNARSKDISSRWVADLFGPNAAESDNDDGDLVMGKIVSFYSAPVVKFLLRFLIHLINLVLYTMLIERFFTADVIDIETAACKADFPFNNTGNNTERWQCMMEPGRMPLMSHWRPVEVAWIVFELSFFSDMRHQKMTRSRKKMPSKIGVGQLAYASDVLVVVSLLLRISMEVIAAHPALEADEETAERRLKNLYTSYQILISVEVAFIFIQTLIYLIIYKPLGVLVVTLGDMVADVANFSVLLGVTICTFMVAFTGLQRAGSFHSEPDGLDGQRVDAIDGPLYSPWWALFAIYDPTQYNVVGLIFMWLYIFCTSIVLVNLLIAMFSETFNRVASSASEEYQHMFFDKVQEHQHVLLALPPVLNLPYAWFDLLRMMWPFGLGCLCRGKGAGGAGPAAKTSSLREASSTSAAQRPSVARPPSYRSRHVLVEEQSEEKGLHDGRSLVETYLTREAELDSQTLPARALVAQQSLDEARRASSLFFCEARTGFEKLQTVADQAAEHRELKVDPQSKDQLARIRRIEAMLDKVMAALNIEETVAEVAPVGPTRRRRRRNPLGPMDGSIHANSAAVQVQAPLVGIWNLGQNAANLAQNAATGVATAASDFYQQGVLRRSPEDAAAARRSRSRSRS